MEILPWFWRDYNSAKIKILAFSFFFLFFSSFHEYILNFLKKNNLPINVTTQRDTWDDWAKLVLYSFFFFMEKGKKKKKSQSA